MLQLLYIPLRHYFFVIQAGRVLPLPRPCPPPSNVPLSGLELWLLENPREWNDPDWDSDALPREWNEPVCDSDALEVTLVESFCVIHAGKVRPRPRPRASTAVG